LLLRFATTAILVNRKITISISQDKSLSDGKFFLELLSAVEPRAVNWSLVTKGENGMSSS